MKWNQFVTTLSQWRGVLLGYFLPPKTKTAWLLLAAASHGGTVVILICATAVSYALRSQLCQKQARVLPRIDLTQNKKPAEAGWVGKGLFSNL